MKWNRRNKLWLYRYLRQMWMSDDIAGEVEWDKYLDEFEIEKRKFPCAEAYWKYAKAYTFSSKGDELHTPNFCYVSGDSVIVDDPCDLRALKIKKDLAEKFLILDFNRTY